MNAHTDDVRPNGALDHSRPRTIARLFRPDQGDHHRGVNLRDYWVMVRRHARLVGGVVAVVTVATTALMAFTRDYYIATARVEVNMERPDRIITDPVDGSTFVSNDPAYFNTQLQMMSSPGLLRHVVLALDLENNGLFVDRMQKGGRLLRRALRLLYLGKSDARTDAGAALPGTVSPEQFAETQRLAPFVAEIQQRLKIEPVLETRTAYRETRLVDLVFKHSSPALASSTVNAIAEAYVAENRDKASRTGANANAYLSKRIEELQAEVRQSEERLITYGKTNKILSLNPTQNVDAERLMNLNRQLLEAEHDRKFAEANLREAQRPEASRGLAVEHAETVIGQAEIRLADLRAKRAQMLVGATDAWPEVQEVTQQIRALESDLQNIRARAVAAAVTSLQTKYNQAFAHERALRSDFELQRGRMEMQNAAAVNYRLIQQEIQTKKRLLDESLKRFGDNDLSQAAIGNNVRVLDYATMPNPEEPAGPWRLLYVLTAAIFALGIGVAAAIAIDVTNATLRSGADVEVTLQVPAVGLIRSAPRQTSGRLPGRAGMLRLEGARDAGPELLFSAATSEAVVEDYRRLRTSMLLPQGGVAPRTLLITSSQQNEGKTTTAVNLAASLAEADATVLLIDADFRQPRLHSLFGLANTAGLSTALARSAGAADLRETEGELSPIPGLAITLDEASGVHVLTAGPEPAAPAELLGSRRMAALLEHLQRRFTYVVIDSPPIIPFTDGVVLGSMVDGVLLVVRASVTSRDVVRHSKHLLNRAGANLVGVVLNGVDVRLDDVYGYYDEAETGTRARTAASHTDANV